MHLRILLPTHVYAALADVSEIIADTQQGSVGLLPQRLDCVAALVPGILTYRGTAGTVYLAVDEGVLVKNGTNVLVSVRHAIAGSDLGALHENVKRDFLAVSEEERIVRLALATMENSFIARLDHIPHG